MQKNYRRYEITIEEAKDEQINLQRFLLEAYRLSVSCFAPVVLEILPEQQHCCKCSCETIFTTCPNCHNEGKVDISPHMYFSEDSLAYRCKKCKHVWKVNNS